MDDDRRSYYGNSSMEIQKYYGPPKIQESVKKGKSISGSSSKSWRFVADPEFQRKKRVASYKMYSVEGKMKGSFRKSFKWLKDKYTQMLYGWW
ncbi:uncharacterized protein LOC120075092 [Benincasa hispida]|uniref:uncharacterized protein LOC120075092 n=1 Tax=Benincasa hispida TaxID=102211 RepID=UPI0019023B7D|nr:uncharacterized protein LOC120075092 [Benincasa hispida]